MGSSMIPHDAIEVRQASPVIERRGVTPSPSDVGAIQHPIIPGVYAAGAAAFLGISMPSVGVGEAVYTVLSTGATPGTPAKDGDQAESDGVFSPFVMSPGRVQASFIFRREDAAVLAGMEESLRANLSGALTEALDKQVISAGAGLLGTGLAAPSDPSAIASFDDYVFWARWGSCGRALRQLRVGSAGSDWAFNIPAYVHDISEQFQRGDCAVHSAHLWRRTSFCARPWHGFALSGLCGRTRLCDECSTAYLVGGIGNSRRNFQKRSRPARIDCHSAFCILRFEG